MICTEDEFHEAAVMLIRVTKWRFPWLDNRAVRIFAASIGLPDHVLYPWPGGHANFWYSRRAHRVTIQTSRRLMRVMWVSPKEIGVTYGAGLDGERMRRDFW